MKAEEASELLGMYARGELVDPRTVSQATTTIHYAYLDLRRKLEKTETMRSQRHHDVLCLVLKELIATNRFGVAGGVQVAVELARDYANFAYPPPSAECKVCGGKCKAAEPTKAPPSAAQPEMTTREVCDALEADRRAKTQPWPNIESEAARQARVDAIVAANRRYINEGREPRENALNPDEGT